METKTKLLSCKLKVFLENAVGRQIYRELNDLNKCELKEKNPFIFIFTYYLIYPILAIREDSLTKNDLDSWTYFDCEASGPQYNRERLG